MCDSTIDTETKSHWIHEQQFILINMSYYFHVWNSKILKPLIHNLKFPAIKPISKFSKIAFFVKLIADCSYFSNHLTPVYFVVNEVLTTFVTHLPESKIHNDYYFCHDPFNIYSRIVSHYARQWLRGDFTFIKRSKEKKVYTKLLYTILCHLFHSGTAFWLIYLLQNTDLIE